MIELYQIEVEFLKVFMLGIFLGWNFRKYLVYPKVKKWSVVKNIRFRFMNEVHKN